VELSVGYLNEINGSPAAAGLRDQGVEPELVCANRLLNFEAVPRLRRHLARVQPDIVHTHLELSDVLGTLAARSLRLPSVSTLHLLAGQPAGQSTDLTPRSNSKARLAASVRRHAAARVLTVSHAARDAYLDTGWDVPQHVVVVHNGIVRPQREGAGERVRQELGLERDALVISMVTVLRPGKGHDIVIEAVRQLLPRFPNLRLLILGDGPTREQIDRLARTLGSVAVLPGHYHDVMAALAATDVLVHPTLMDAFPTALLEAAAARVPVIATDVGGVPEIVEDGHTGFLIDAPPSATALVARLTPLLSDEQLRHRIGECARMRFLERFTAELWVGRVRTVCDEVLKERARV
jgi:glycosyltransferase involved in cell wall biosynthesis